MTGGLRQGNKRDRQDTVNTSSRSSGGGVLQISFSVAGKTLAFAAFRVAS
jgi:hypothetical protein